MLRFNFKLYGPDSILDFGKYIGECVRFVYVYDPAYIDWLILNNDEFMIFDFNFAFIHTFPISEVNSLKPEEIEEFRNKSLSFDFRDYLKRNPELLKHYNSPPSIVDITEYKFSPKAVFIMNVIKDYLRNCGSKKLNYWIDKSLELKVSTSFEELKEFKSNEDDPWDNHDKIYREAYVTARRDFRVDMGDNRHEDEF